MTDNTYRNSYTTGYPYMPPNTQPDQPATAYAPYVARHLKHSGTSSNANILPKKKLTKTCKRQPSSTMKDITLTHICSNFYGKA